MGAIEAIEDVQQSQVGKSVKWLFGNNISWRRRGQGKSPGPESASEPGPILSDCVFTDECGGAAAESTRDAGRAQSGLLYADIAGYARLAAQPCETAQRRLEDAIKTMIANVAGNQGRIVHLAGDAVLAEFDSADSALHCAINVQLAARQWNDALGPEQQVKFRIGVSIGDAMPDHGDRHAAASGLAARLEKLASAGGICVSGTIGRALRAHPSFRFVPMDEQDGEDIGEPLQAFWIEIDSQRIGDPENSGADKVTALAS